MNSKTILELERTVLSFLMYRPHDELPIYLDQLIYKEWSPQYEKMLEIISAYTLEENPGGTVIDALIQQYTPSSEITKLATEFVPLYIGKEAMTRLAYLQEERAYKKKLSDLIKKPLKDIKPALYDLVQTPISAYRPKSLLQTAKERIYERKLESQAPSTGYRDLDKFIKGFIPGHVYVLSGDTNAGKSTLCLNFAQRISEQGKTTLYFALEPENTIVDYLASIRLRKRFSEVSDDDIMYEDEHIQVFGKDQIRESEDLVKAVHSLPRYDLIVIDHIGYFTSNTTNTTSKQSDVMKHLAGLAKSRLSAVMLIQHLNKARSDKKTPENNITGSGAFKQDATDVLILRRDTEEDEFGATKSLNTGSILIRKSKSDNPQGSVPISFVDGSALILDGQDQVRSF